MNYWPDFVGTLRSSLRIGLNKAVIDASGLTTSRTQALPDKAGTFAMTSDVPAAFNGGTVTAAITVSQAVAAVAVDGISLVTTTAATVGAQKQSSRARFLASGWKTTATAGAQNVEMGIDLRPVQGTTAPTGKLTIQAAINGGSFADVFTLDTTGHIRVGSGSSALTSLGVLGGNDGTGWWFNSNGSEMTYSYLGFQMFTIGNGFTRVRSDSLVGFSSSTDSTGTTDVALARDAANRMAVVTTAAGSYGDLKSRDAISTGGRSTATVAKSSAYTFTLHDHTIEGNATSGALVITLPALSTVAPGQEAILVKTDAGVNAVTFDGNGSETIMGAPTLSTMVQGTALRIKANAARTDWIAW